MICFVADSTSIREAIDRVGVAYPRLSAAIRFVEYSQLLSLGSLPAATYVFTDTVSFGEARRELALLAERRMMEQSDKFRILNSPLRGARARQFLARTSNRTLIAKAGHNSAKFPLVLRSIGAVDEGERYEDAEQLAFHIAERILDGEEAGQLAFTSPDPGEGLALIFSDVCLNLLDCSIPSVPFTSQFGLDVFAIRFRGRDGKETTVGLSDHLRDILPACSSPSRLSEAVSSAILQLDTVAAAGAVPIRVDWEAMAKAMRLKSPS